LTFSTKAVLELFNTDYAAAAYSAHRGKKKVPPPKKELHKNIHKYIWVENSKKHDRKKIYFQ